jgi:hypothetical protein
VHKVARSLTRDVSRITRADGKISLSIEVCVYSNSLWHDKLCLRAPPTVRPAVTATLTICHSSALGQLRAVKRQMDFDCAFYQQTAGQTFWPLFVECCGTSSYQPTSSSHTLLLTFLKNPFKKEAQREPQIDFKAAWASRAERFIRQTSNFESNAKKRSNGDGPR